MKFVSQLLFLAAAGAAVAHAQVCDIPRPDLKPDGMTFAPTVIDEYKSLAAANPASAEDLYLYGRVLTGTKTPEAIAVLNRALAADERYTPAHLALVQIYEAPKFLDLAKAQTHLEAWMKACPASLEGFRYLERMGNSSFVRDNVTRLRELIAKSDDPAEASHYRMLWTLEFQVHPPNEYPQIREQMRKDLQRLRAMDLTKTPSLAATLREGYNLVEDKEGLSWIDAQSPAPPKPDTNGPIEAYQAWQKAHPFPTMQSNPNLFQPANQERNKALYAATADWVAKWPDSSFIREQRLQAVRMNRELSDAEVEREAEAYIKAYDSRMSRSSPYFQVASLYLQRNMHPSELPEMIRKGLADVESKSLTMTSDLYPGASRIGTSAGTISGWSTLADVYLQTGNLEGAAEALASLGKVLESAKPADDAEAMEKRMWAQNDGQYWDKKARLAEKQGKKLDALAYYRNEMSDSNLPGGNRLVTQKAKSLWTDLGGTAEGWDTWTAFASAPKPIAPIATPGGWQTISKALPEFEIVDVAGKTWRLFDLKGKTTLINLWATWCAPCVQELPKLQQLYDQLKDRPDIRIVTLNTDENAGLVDPFLKDKHFTFPVLFAHDYVNKFVPSQALPTNWIVDTEGVSRLERLGFGDSNGKWIEDTKEKIENSAKTK